MRIPLIFPNNKNIDLFKEKKFLELVEAKNYRCICGRIYPREAIKVDSGFYTCPYCRSLRKFNEKNVINNSNYIVSANKLKNNIKKKLRDLEIGFTDKFNEIYLGEGEMFIPLSILEFSNPSLLDPENNSLILYYHAPEFEKHKNIYSQKRILELGKFFKMDKDAFNDLWSTMKKSLEIDKILKIKIKIDNFCKKNSDEDFEKEVSKLFMSLRDKPKEVESMLKFFKKNRNLLFSKKPIHVGGNHPLDVEFIDLFDYFNQLFNITLNKGAEAKKYCIAEITKDTITNKLVTTYGREIIFITNKDKVSKNAWKYIWDTKNSNQRWKIFILDLDLLSLILYHLDINDLFNP